jgi:glycosyl transferase family 25
MDSDTRIFVINLKTSLSRKELLQKRLAELNLKAEFIEAVNGSALSESEVREHTQPLNYAYLPGEIGCALSHQLIYKRMVAENISKALILEDDVHLPDNVAEILSRLVMVPHSAEVTLLSRVNKYSHQNVQPVGSGYKLHPVHQATTAHAYLITKQAAENLLQALYPVWMVSDKWSLFQDYGWINVKAVIPAPVTLCPASSESTINSRKGCVEIADKKRALWNALMKQRPLKVKLKSRLRRALVPLIYGVTDQKKGP